MAKEEKVYTKNEALKAWNDKVGKTGQYSIQEVTGGNGVVQTQLVDKNTGSVSVAVNATGADAYKRLAEGVGELALDPAVVGEAQYRELHPEQVEVNPKVDTGRVAAERESSGGSNG